MPELIKTPGYSNIEFKTTDPIVDAVCAKFQSRSAVGIKKYGTTLADSNAPMEERLTHLQEELMDAVNYIEWILHANTNDD